VKPTLYAFMLLAVCQGSLSADDTPVQLCESWQLEYSGEAATGKHVIGLWNFNAGSEMKDSSGHGHDLTLQDGKINPDGRGGSCLESFCGWPVEDAVHRVQAKDHADLSPPGAFTIELWIKPKAELNADYGESFLIDKKYVAHDDYQLILGRADRYGNRALRACLGFGVNSSNWYARPFAFATDRWYHVAFTYDGAGTGSFFVDGCPWGSERIDGRKSISPGRHFLSIGDRVGSLYHGFPGLIDQVRLSRGVLEFRRAKFDSISYRHCFVRMESGTSQLFRVTNLQRTPLNEATVTISCDGMAANETRFANLASGGSVEVEYPLDTSVRPDSYPLVARLVVGGDDPLETEETFSVQIVPRPMPLRFPVLMWGVYGGVTNEVERLKRIGFTHVLGVSADSAKIWESGQPTEAGTPERVADTRAALEAALANDLTLAASLSPGSYARGKEEFRRVDREGKVTAREDVCGLFPEVQKFCYNVGASIAKTYGDHPALGAAMIHTEVRDHAEPCFHPHDFAAFKKHSGIDIPAEVSSRRGVNYIKLPDFPKSRVIPDDHPIYRFYRWYWKEGDGWPGLNTALQRGLESAGRDDLWTYHDPAVRVASVYGSGGEVDYLSQWTYSYPDPIRIGLATDELFAMVGGTGGKQQVMKMTQVIWYRSQTAPQPKKPGDELTYKARWEQEQPGAPFITIAPMHLREAFWTKMARPIKGIMYHGYQSLVPCDTLGGYRFTNPATQHELARLIRQVVRPLGPMLLNVPAAKSDVAFLECFASEMFARRGTYGWGGSWAGDAYHVLLYAGLQPEIVFDETIIDRGLDGFRVLVMTDCDVITEKMRQRIKAFQAAGGLIVGDERITPAIKPDIVIPVYSRTGRADRDKAEFLKLAAGLRGELEPRYSRYVNSSNPEVLPYLRRHGKTDYVFVVNDHREYGDYVGQHGLVMENGLPSDAELCVNRPSAFVYDLVEHRQVSIRRENGKTVMDVHLGPCDGRVFMMTDRAIDKVDVALPKTVKRGRTADCTVTVTDSEGRPLDAVIPMEITILDAQGRPAEFSGYYATTEGTVKLALDIAPNDRPGIWQIEARELAGGRTTIEYLRVEGPAEWPPGHKPIPKELANPVQPDG
jgi:concanavalin A-like lectin/glucanase superfamily protein